MSNFFAAGRQGKRFTYDVFNSLGDKDKTVIGLQ